MLNEKVLSKSQRWAAQKTITLFTLVSFIGQSVGLANVPSSTIWSERRVASQNKKESDSTPRPSSPTMMASLPSVHSALQFGAAGSAIKNTSLEPTFISPKKNPKLNSIFSEASQRAITPFATINEVHLQPGAEKTVFLLQDAHLHKEAQLNIAGTIEALGLSEQKVATDGNKKTDLLVGLEGARHGLLDFSPYNKYHHRKALKQAAEEFMKANILNGVELASIGFQGVGEGEVDLPYQTVGVEDWHEYIANVKSLQAAYPKKKEAQKTLEKLKAELLPLKAAHFTAELHSFDAKSTASKQGTLSLPEYVLYLDSIVTAQTPDLRELIEAALLEGNIDFEKVEKEREVFLAELIKKLSNPEIQNLLNASTLFRAGQMSMAAYYSHLKSLAHSKDIKLMRYPEMNLYVQYVLKSEAINHSQLFEDVEALEGDVREKLALTPEQKTLVEITQEIDWLQKLVRHELTEHEWQAYHSRQKNVKSIPTRLAHVKDRSIPGSLSRSSSLDDFLNNISLFEDFYTHAENRNESMVRNFAVSLRQSKTPLGVLVAGGFHAEGLTSELKNAGFNVILASPKITRLEEGLSTIEILESGRLPLNQMFVGERLFLPLPARATATGVPGAVTAAANQIAAGANPVTGPGQLAVGPGLPAWGGIHVGSLFLHALIGMPGSLGELLERLRSVQQHLLRAVGQDQLDAFKLLDDFLQLKPLMFDQKEKPRTEFQGVVGRIYKAVDDFDKVLAIYTGDTPWDHKMSPQPPTYVVDLFLNALGLKPMTPAKAGDFGRNLVEQFSSIQDNLPPAITSEIRVVILDDSKNKMKNLAFAHVASRRIFITKSALEEISYDHTYAMFDAALPFFRATTEETEDQIRGRMMEKGLDYSYFRKLALTKFLLHEILHINGVSDENVLRDHFLGETVPSESSLSPFFSESYFSESGLRGVARMVLQGAAASKNAVLIEPKKAPKEIWDGRSPDGVQTSNIDLYPTLELPGRGLILTSFDRRKENQVEVRIPGEHDKVYRWKEKESVTFIHFGPRLKDNRVLFFVGREDGVVRVYAIDTSEAQPEPEDLLRNEERFEKPSPAGEFQYDKSRITSLLNSPDGKWLIVGDETGKASLIDVFQKKHLYAMQVPGRIKELGLTKDKKFIFVNSDVGIGVFRTSSGALIKYFPNQRRVLSRPGNIPLTRIHPELEAGRIDVSGWLSAPLRMTDITNEPENHPGTLIQRDPVAFYHNIEEILNGLVTRIIENSLLQISSPQNMLLHFAAELTTAWTLSTQVNESLDAKDIELVQPVIGKETIFDVAFLPLSREYPGPVWAAVENFLERIRALAENTPRDIKQVIPSIVSELMKPHVLGVFPIVSYIAAFAGFYVKRLSGTEIDRAFSKFLEAYFLNRNLKGVVFQWENRNQDVAILNKFAFGIPIGGRPGIDVVIHTTPEAYRQILSKTAEGILTRAMENHVVLRDVDARDLAQNLFFLREVAQALGVPDEVLLDYGIADEERLKQTGKAQPFFTTEGLMGQFEKVLEDSRVKTKIEEGLINPEYIRLRNYGSSGTSLGTTPLDTRNREEVLKTVTGTLGAPTKTLIQKFPQADSLRYGSDPDIRINTQGQLGEARSFRRVRDSVSELSRARMIADLEKEGAVFRNSGEVYQEMKLGEPDTLVVFDQKGGFKDVVDRFVQHKKNNRNKPFVIGILATEADFTRDLRDYINNVESQTPSTADENDPTAKAMAQAIAFLGVIRSPSPLEKIIFLDETTQQRLQEKSDSGVWDVTPAAEFFRSQTAAIQPGVQRIVFVSDWRKLVAQEIGVAIEMIVNLNVFMTIHDQVELHTLAARQA